MNVRKLSSWRKKEVEEVLKRSYRLYRSSAFDVRIARHTNNQYARILVITPKSLGSAPVRNSFKRRVKALFYEEKLYKHPYHWIVFAKKEATDLSFQELKSRLLFVNNLAMQATQAQHSR